MKLRPARPGEYRYAVAIREGPKLWLTLWVRRSPKGDVFVFVPRAERKWTPHASYHVDGTSHVKSYNHVSVSGRRQPVTGAFKGTENVCCFAGHGSNGEICDPAIFAGVVEVAPGTLGANRDTICVDLVEPGCEPLAAFHFPQGMIIQREIFRDTTPFLGITVWLFS